MPDVSVTIYKRAGSRYWQAHIRGPVSIQRSTGTTSRTEAMRIAMSWVANGLPDPAKPDSQRSIDTISSADALIRQAQTADISCREATRIVDALADRGLVSVVASLPGKGEQTLAAFLEGFWDYDRSPYVRDRIAHGQAITRYHCQDMAGRVTGYWVPALGQAIIGAITKIELKTFAAGLADRHLAPATINKIMQAATTALRWAAANDLIADDPTIGLLRFSGSPRARGVLEGEEVAKLFAPELWFNDRCRLASMVAASTGLRLGEIRALRVTDIGKESLQISHAWNEADGLKGTKTGKAREVPLLPKIRRALLDQAALNPHGPAGFIFWGSMPDKPLDGAKIRHDLEAAFQAMRASGAATGEARARVIKAAAREWKERNLTFHSWRHFYASRLADTVDARKAMLATGHASSAMFEHYAAHARAEDLAEVGRAVGELFSAIF